MRKFFYRKVLCPGWSEYVTEAYCARGSTTAEVCAAKRAFLVELVDIKSLSCGKAEETSVVI